MVNDYYIYLKYYLKYITNTISNNNNTLKVRR